MHEEEVPESIRRAPKRPEHLLGRAGSAQKLSWNKVRVRAARFATEWRDAHYEKGETQTFYNEFFEIFGVRRRQVASFEEPVKKLGDKRGFIDLFWKGLLLIEQKSAGRDLSKAKAQAFDYFPNLKEYELPRYVLVSDFQTFELYDLDEGKRSSFRSRTSRSTSRPSGLSSASRSARSKTKIRSISPLPS